jgi:sugar phosphate isomerase/epimerase
MNLSRRELLKLGAGTGAVLATGLRPLAALAAEKKIPLGLQLYSVRQDAPKDLPGVLEAVAKMGYDGVEFAGYYGHSAEALKKLLDDNGLKCCGTHTGLNTLTGDQLKKTVEFHQKIGNKYLIVPGMPGNMRDSLDAIKKTAELFNGIAEKLKPEGMHTGYHAHGGDFRKIGDETAWDLLFLNTSDDVVMQLDVGNCLGGGGDPYATLKRFPGRSKTVHLKEHGGPGGAPVGEGKVDWKQVFEICESVGGTEWYIVEQERYATTPLESVKACIENLRKMGV